MSSSSQDESFVALRATSYFLEHVAPKLDAFRAENRSAFLLAANAAVACKAESKSGDADDEDDDDYESGKGAAKERAKNSAEEKSAERTLTGVGSDDKGSKGDGASDGVRTYAASQYEMYASFSELFESKMASFLTESTYDLATFNGILKKGLEDSLGESMCGLFVELLQALSDFPSFAIYMSSENDEEGDFVGVPDDEEGDEFEGREYPIDEEEGLVGDGLAGMGEGLVVVGKAIRREEVKGGDECEEGTDDSYNAEFDDELGRK